jgi:hypothetical protein
LLSRHMTPQKHTFRIKRANKNKSSWHIPRNKSMEHTQCKNFIFNAPRSHHTTLDSDVNEYAEYSVVQKQRRHQVNNSTFGLSRQQKYNNNQNVNYPSCKREMFTRTAVTKVRQKLADAKWHKRNIKVVIKNSFES